MQILKIPIFNPEAIKFFTEIVNETIKIREEKSILRPDLINLLLEARKSDKKIKYPAAIETGFATVKESVTSKGKDPDQK